MSFQVALVQMLVRGGRKSANLRNACALISEASGKGADLVLLPEAMDLGWVHPSSRREAEPIPDGQACRLLAREAARHRVFVCAGLTELEGDRVFNSAVLIDRAGTVILKHRKLNELEIGHACYALGDRLNVVHTELGTIGIMICADGFARGGVIGRALGYMGADVILSPCAWAVEADHDSSLDPYGQIWRDSYRPLAKEFALWIIAASNVGVVSAGPWAGRHCIGNSLVFAPGGVEVLQGPFGVDAESVLYAEVEPAKRPARGCAWEAHWNANP